MSAIQHQVGATCPSCGRFVGPLEKCPYCGADIKKRLPLKYLRLACLILAVAGIALLLYGVSGSSTPATKIGNVGATMNYAYVKIKGTVTRGPMYDADTKALRFYIADDTGEIQAATFRDVTEQLIAQNKIPTTGDAIQVEGTLRVRDDFTSFNVASANKLTLTPPSVSEISIKEIGYDDELRYVTVRGDVREIRTPYEGLTLVSLGDAGGEIDVAFNADIEKLYGALPTFELGDSVQVQGIVTYFRDSPQLFLRHPRDFKKLDVDNTAGTKNRIGDLDESRVNQRVQVSGNVTRVSKFSQGMRAVIADDTGEITVVLWQDVYDEIGNASDLQKGAHVNVLGKLTQYRGELEIVPNRAGDVRISPAVAQNVLTAAGNATTAAVRATVPGYSSGTYTPTASTILPTETPRPTRAPTAAPVARTIGSITAADKDARVIVSAKISRASKFSQGMRYTLDDGTGKITLLIWADVLEKISVRDELKAGAEIRVTGQVDLFNDELEIIPERAQDVELVAAAVVPTVTIRTIDSITTDDLDKIVFLQGTISELDDFSAGKYVTLQDDTGTIRVTVFKNVLTPIQDQLAIGANISVRGKVNVFRGNLEIVADEITIH